MPVTEVTSGSDTIGPFNRLSASQVNSFRACERLWFYEKVLKLKIKQIPVLYVGRAVESAICRTLKESPKLLLANASEHTLANIPLAEDGKPSRDSQRIWPASRILPVSDGQVPKTIEEIKQWAITRLSIHLKSSLEEANKDWARQERKFGAWSDVNFDYCMEMCINGLNLHLAEVERCLKTIPEQVLEHWRSGARDYWPAPDGFGYKLTGRHPLSTHGNITATEAWEIARPWFVEPESGQFSMNAIHPDYWFQGEYDLVYRWDGRIKIVDIKASKGIGDRSGDYIEQLRMYAMLWWTTHQREEVVTDLEIWYLGANMVKPVEVPNIQELAQMEAEIKQLWVQLKDNVTSIEMFPANPLPLRGYSQGGVSQSPPENEVRCDRCDWSSICEGGGGKEFQQPALEYHLPGLVTPVTTVPFSQLNVRFNLSASIDSVIYHEGKPPKIRIIQDGYRADIEIKAEKNQDGLPTYPQGLSKNDTIYLQNVVITSNYQGKLTAKVDPISIITISNDGADYTDSLLNFRARWDIVGKMAYKFERSGIGRNGREWRRKGLVIFDGKQSIKVSGWANDWGHQYDMAEEGDIVLLSNLELDAWANQLRGQIGRNSRLDVVNPSTT